MKKIIGLNILILIIGWFLGVLLEDFGFRNWLRNKINPPTYIELKGYVYNKLSNYPLTNITIDIDGYPDVMTNDTGFFNMTINTKDSILDITIYHEEDRYYPDHEKIEINSWQKSPFLFWLEPKLDTINNN